MVCRQPIINHLTAVFGLFPTQLLFAYKLQCKDCYLHHQCPCQWQIRKPSGKTSVDSGLRVQWGSILYNLWSFNASWQIVCLFSDYWLVWSSSRCLLAPKSYLHVCKNLQSVFKAQVVDALLVSPSSKFPFSILKVFFQCRNHEILGHG